jgi:hypothetical protein
MSANRGSRQAALSFHRGNSRNTAIQSVLCITCAELKSGVFSVCDPFNINNLLSERVPNPAPASSTIQSNRINGTQSIVAFRFVRRVLLLPIQFQPVAPVRKKILAHRKWGAYTCQIPSSCLNATVFSGFNTMI